MSESSLQSGFLFDWNDAARVQRFITEEIPRLVSEDEAYRNAQANDDPVNALWGSF